MCKNFCQNREVPALPLHARCLAERISCSDHSTFKLAMQGVVKGSTWFRHTFFNLMCSSYTALYPLVYSAF